MIEVAWDANHRKYYARLRVGDRRVHGGHHATLETAIAARRELERRFHPFRPDREGDTALAT